MSYLLDTCVLSEFSRRIPSESVARWLEQQEEPTLFITTLSIGEIERGIAAVRNDARRRRLRTFLENSIVERFRTRLLETDEAVWRRWGALTGSAQRTGRVLPAIDALLAAVALTHGLTVVTRNDKDFLSCGVPVVNPWKD
ncbi:MAG: type II toxin-antitoxin system VapC family toxin [Archangium sp.]